MARQTSAITFTRKFGNAVGMKGMDGNYNMRIYVPGDEINDGKTPMQTAQRARFTIATKVAGMLGVLGEQVLFANGLKTTRRGKLVQQIMASVTFADHTATLSGNLPLIISPKNSVDIANRTLTKTAPTANASGSVAYSAKVTIGRGIYVRTITAMLIYDRTTAQWDSQVEITTDVNVTTRKYISSMYAGHTVDIYCYMLSGATIASLGQQTADMSSMDSNSGAGFAIRVTESGMTTDELAYAQVDSYHEEWAVPAILGD